MQSLDQFSCDRRVVEYRPLAERDIPRLKELHGKCFPVQYDDRFYSWLLEPACLSVVAVLCPTRPEGGEGGGGGGGGEGGGGGNDVGKPPSTQAKPHGEERLMEMTEENDSEMRVEEEKELVVGFCIGKIKYVQGTVFSTPVGYISTFGVDPEQRRRGLGNELLERFAHLIYHDVSIPAPNHILCFAVPRSLRTPKIRQLWLHCLASDDSIAKFYKKRQFVLVERIAEYYSFGDRPHDAFVMCREVDALQRVVSDKEKLMKRAGGRSRLAAIVSCLEEDDDDGEELIVGNDAAGATVPSFVSSGRRWQRVVCAGVCCIVVMAGVALVVALWSSPSSFSTIRPHDGYRFHKRTP